MIEWYREGAMWNGGKTRLDVLDDLRSNDLAGTAPGCKSIHDNNGVVLENLVELSLSVIKLAWFLPFFLLTAPCQYISITKSSKKKLN